MKVKLTVALLCTAISFGATAQHTEKCASQTILDAKIAANPEVEKAIKAGRKEADERIARYEAQQANNAQKTTGTNATIVTIPLVFHFVLTAQQQTEIGGMSNMTRRVLTQINVLNNDFNGKNTDISNVPAAFKSVIGNAEITFALARRNEQGKTTSGIELKTATATEFSENSGDEKYSTRGGLNAWNPDKYLNVWVVNLRDGLLGYAISGQNAKQAGIPQEGGVVIDYAAFGTKITADNFFISGIDRGRTMVHELGHFFDVNHIWGEKDDCTDDDGVSDTPQQDEANKSCPATPPANCTNSTGGEMYMNYMDYVNDACMYMFTKGQVNRMRAQIATGGPLYSLTQNTELTTWPTEVSDIENANALNIYPNPASSAFSLNFAQQTQGLKAIDIVNITGQTVKSIAVSQQNSFYTVEAGDLAKGIYVLHCRFEEGTVTRKIVLQ